MPNGKSVQLKTLNMWIPAHDCNICLSTEPCPVGTYSATGYTRDDCIDCPLHFYQDQPGQPVCMECPMDKQTLYTGRNSSSDCVDITEGKTPHVNNQCHFHVYPNYVP